MLVRGLQIELPANVDRMARIVNIEFGFPPLRRSKPSDGLKRSFKEVDILPNSGGCEAGVDLGTAIPALAKKEQQPAPRGRFRCKRQTNPGSVTSR